MLENGQTKPNEYSKIYSEKSLFEKIMTSAQKAGIAVIYAGLLLFYTLQKPLIPGWTKATILGALGYFISPVDLIPDLTPAFGYGDDLGVLAMAVVTVAMYIDKDTKQKAKAKLKEWFGEYDEKSLTDIDNRLII